MVDYMQNDHKNYYCFEWYNTTRYYCLEISKDLFGMWLVTRTWRSRVTKKGRSLTISVDTDEQMHRWITQVTDQRKRRGYSMV
jgi:predicted DNA-binding WGR domain protein